MSMENKEQIGEIISVAMARDQDLRERVRAMVMRALSERTWDKAEIRDVISQAFAGVGAGMPQRGSQAAAAAREAVQGLDEAVGRSVYALQMALEEAWEQGRQFTDTDMKSTVDELKGLEEDLLGTLKDSADRGQGFVKEALSGLYDHLKLNGTDTGSQVQGVLDLLANRLAGAAHGAGSELKEQAREGRDRLKSVASGILRGLADGLDKPK
ncbi:MAG: hypothetical protein H6935_01335 [Thiobacillus sp.]|nr:hypothetical protein [Thiobacillus sp.]